MSRASTATTAVMPAHSRSKNGVASLAYARASTPCFLLLPIKKDVDGRNKSGHDERRVLPLDPGSSLRSVRDTKTRRAVVRFMRPFSRLRFAAGSRKSWRDL